MVRISFLKQQFIIFALLLLLSACTVSYWQISANDSPRLTVSAATSFQDILQEIGKQYIIEHPKVKIDYNFASSGSLQHQIEQGAPVDVFISASLKQIETLKSKNLLLRDNYIPLVKNKIVLITSKSQIDISDLQQLTDQKINKIVIGEPKSVPVGQYAKEALTTLGIYQSLQEKLVFAGNVRQALTYVERGNVDGGIVYQTDAKLSNNVRVIAQIPEEYYSPIIYPVAVLKSSRHIEESQKFVQFLFKDFSGKIFQLYGFVKI